MANHVIYDTVWGSKRLRRCSREAAMAYPWIFLVADDHGRFEFDPRVIWSKCFATRDDITVADVSTWLSEFEREELLFRYGVGGQYAHWYNFKGRKPSERRKSNYPEPPKVSGGGKRATRGRRGGDDPPPARDNPAPDIDIDLDLDTDQIRSRNGTSPDAAAPGVALAQPDAATQVFEHWRDVMPGRSKAKLTPGRRQKILARLREGYTAYQLLEAIDGCRASAFHMGDNDRHTVYDDITLICRSGEKVEQFRRNVSGAAPIVLPQARGSPRPTTVGEKSLAASQRFIDRGKTGGGA